MKKYQIKAVLDQEENFERFYDDIKNRKKQPKLENQDEDGDLPPGYESIAELEFYGKDVDFMRFHKRTKKNMFLTLQELLDDTKQTVSKGLK